jgi:hypothetical protein
VPNESDLEISAEHLAATPFARGNPSRMQPGNLLQKLATRFILEHAKNHMNGSSYHSRLE